MDDDSRETHDHGPSPQPSIAALVPKPQALEQERRALQPVERLMLVASIALVWFLAWAHPLYPPDEGRYASSSAAMADSGQWLLPQFHGHAHLTKPPLTYWCQALGVLAFGRTEIAVRLPGLLATSAMLGVLFGFARRALGTRPAVMAVAFTSIMPLTLVVGRLATTDALLNLVWTAQLAVGWLVARRAAELRPPRASDLVLFWCLQALGFLIKGPAALGPLLILAAWLALSKRWRALGRFHPWFGFPIAVLPLALWATIVVAHHPGAVHLWWDETFGRVLGEKHLRSEPFWFYLPIFLGGLYPATALLTLPVLNLSWRDSWRALCTGDLRALLLLAVVFPLLGFSVSTGKMPTYLLPLAPPLAMLVAITLERWLRGEFDGASAHRPPDVRITLLVVSALLFAFELGAALRVGAAEPELWPMTLPLAIVPLAAFVLWRLWRYGGALRARALAATWVAFLGAWTVIFAIEARFATPRGAPTLLDEVERHFSAGKQVVIATVGFIDPTMTFYRAPEEPSIGESNTLPGIALSRLGSLPPQAYPLIVVVDASVDEAERAAAPEIAARLRHVGRWTRWFSMPVEIYELADAPRE